MLASRLTAQARVAGPRARSRTSGALAHVLPGALAWTAIRDDSRFGATTTG